MITQLLEESTNFFPLLPQGYEIGLDWLGQFARIIIEGVGIIGLGIILFTLLLKGITLPFDIYQRVKMRKQNLIMREMQPELEKLQKQYANDKTTYNQKMLELQKKNGYSIFGACLPMILSLVILIVAFQGFRTYSQYANLQTFKEMSEAYNEAVLEYGVDGVDYRLATEGGFTLVYPGENGEETRIPIEFTDGATLRERGIDTGELEYTMRTVTEKTADGTPYTAYYFDVYSTNAEKFLGYRYNPTLSSATRSYRIDTARLSAIETVTVYKKTDAGVQPQPVNVQERVRQIMEEESKSEDDAYFLFVVEIGSGAAMKCFSENSPSFLWVGNVWYPDVSYNHPIPDYDTFKSQLNVNVYYEDGTEQALASVLDSDRYEYLTRSLSDEKNAPNGYFILILLSIGTMLLSQFITMRSSKESNKYQTVDGQGATTQKVMLVVMPLIYAVFAFLYSAAFSIYMTMSSVISLVVTLLTNLILDKAFKKREEEAFKKAHTQELPWMKKDDGKKNKKDKAVKKDKTDKTDEKSGKNDKKRK